MASSSRLGRVHCTRNIPGYGNMLHSSFGFVSGENSWKRGMRVLVLSLSLSLSLSLVLCMYCHHCYYICMYK